MPLFTATGLRSDDPSERQLPVRKDVPVRVEKNRPAVKPPESGPVGIGRPRSGRRVSCRLRRFLLRAFLASLTAVACAGLRIVVNRVMDSVQTPEKQNGSVSETESNPLVDHEQFSASLNSALDTLRTKPPLPNDLRDELRNMRVFLGPGHVVSELPDWLQERGFSLTGRSEQEVAKLQDQWRRLNESFAVLVR